jgi:hypothetical protein
MSNSRTRSARIHELQEKLSSAVTSRDERAASLSLVPTIGVSLGFDFGRRASGAPPTIVGLLRKAQADARQAVVRQEPTKDLAYLSNAEITQRVLGRRQAGPWP